MAFFDNKLWLLSHIRNSYICTDDTGMCETVMASENIPKQLPRVTNNDTYPGFDESSDEDDMDLQESYDIHLNYFDNSVYRQRSNTAQHIEKMNVARKKAAKIKNIKWEIQQQNLTDEEKAELFSKKPCQLRDNTKKVSLLSDQIIKNANLPKNPFISYSKFDGSARIGVPTRKYKIFFTMLPESERNYPLSVCIVATARIIDLIGLSCLKYSMTHSDYQFKSISHYDLYITEDDGEMDKDFPPLDTRECVNKFSFNCLSLVEHNNKKSISFESTEPHQKSKEFDDRQNEERKYLSVGERFGSGKVRPPENIEALDKLKSYTGAILAPIYKCYKVYIITKVRAKIEVNLGVSGEKIEIDPVQQKNNKFWVRQKPVSYQIDNIAWCEITDDSKHSRTAFQIVYTSSGSESNTADHLLAGSSHTSSLLKTSPSFKHHDFETERSVAEEIVKKINHILEMKASVGRKNYLTIKEYKANRRRSFHLVKRNL